MLNKKILLCGVVIALYTHVDAASNDLMDLSREELNGRLERLESSCPIALIKTSFPHIILVPVVSVNAVVPLAEELTEQCRLDDWREHPINAECLGLTAGAALVWASIMTCLEWGVDIKRTALRNALKEKRD